MIPGYGGNADYSSDWNDPLAADPFGVVDWEHIETGDSVDREYVIPGLVTAGAGVSIYSPAGAGKSLLGFEWAVCLALGEPIVGEPVKGRTVLYLDFENDLQLIRERLEALEVAPTRLTRRLYYSLLGDWKPFDTPDGGRQLIGQVTRYGAEVVFIDTTSRVLSGPENDADTFLNLYQCTMLPLKSAGVTVIRLDHSGKDLSKGERGSSAKRSDVDLTYRLTASDDVVTLAREKNRLHLDGAETVTLQRTEDPLRHMPTTVDKRAREILEIIGHLDRLDVPPAAGRDAVRALFKQQNGLKYRNDTLSQAIARRRFRGHTDDCPLPRSRESGKGGQVRSGGPGTAEDGSGQQGNRVGTVPGTRAQEGCPGETGDRPVSHICDCGRQTHAPGDWGPCVRCETIIHRYGPGARTLCPHCLPEQQTRQ